MNLSELSDNQFELTATAELLRRADERANDLLAMQDSWKTTYESMVEIFAPLAKMNELTAGIHLPKNIFDGRSLSETLAQLRQPERLGQQIAEILKSSGNLLSVIRLEHLSALMRPPEGLQAVIDSLSVRPSFDFTRLTPALSAFDEFKEDLRQDHYNVLLTQWPQPLREHFMTVDLVSEIGNVDREENLAEDTTRRLWKLRITHTKCYRLIFDY